MSNNNPSPQGIQYNSAIKTQDVEVFIKALDNKDPITTPLTGSRLLEFLAFKTFENKYKRPRIKFEFRDIETGALVCRTVNIELAPRSYLYKFLCEFLPEGRSSILKAGGDPRILTELITNQVGKTYTAECEPSKTGEFTDILSITLN